MVLVNMVSTVSGLRMRFPVVGDTPLFMRVARISTGLVSMQHANYGVRD
jgi:hypothetical protein